ncbi:MAG: dihydroorotase [Candidatus Marinimicrobia bacterium]|nr:dihydroorotase [Candidatus Neomarinimicrobiota bacterium]MBL7023239.1 dihydroorotase [Candidatus Neomarinimicrobiota bacterium]MBL7110025.1 dihydroorotase [Candidatus Neomarinimicrobiota bacterium]
MKKEFQMNGKWLLANGNIYNPFLDETQQGSILLEDGIVKYLGKDNNIPKDANVIDCDSKMITVGFMDLHAHFREPGREDKETLETGSLAALAGGFTKVCVMPNTNPPLDSPESIRFIVEKASNLPIDIYPIGAITNGQKGQNLSEISEMINAGAVAISDDGVPVKNGQILRYALEYSKMCGITVINHSEDEDIRADGVMNESSMSTNLGLPGNPDYAESVMIFRDLSIAEFVDGKIHIPHVSTAKSVEVIKYFKDKGVNVTAEVSPHHLGLTENRLSEFDTNAKVAPPLRSEKDRLALIQGLKDGIIDCVATDHAPHTIEEKEADFIQAPFGMIGLESAFGITHTVMTNNGASTEDVVRWLTDAPMKIMNFKLKAFETGKKADITIIDPQEKWIFSKEHVHSRSKNSPMYNMEFTGRVITTISGNIGFGEIISS